MKQYFQKEISCNKQFSSTNFRSSKRVERKTFLDFFFKEKIQDLESRVFNIAAVYINQKYELVHTGVCQKKTKTGIFILLKDMEKYLMNQHILKDLHHRERIWV